MRSLRALRVSRPMNDLERYTVYINSFPIINSPASNRLKEFIPSDTAICDECIKEINDKTNRRYMYPFTSCTSCGPRYSIIKTLPCDRVNTSMSAFEMCPACRSEYESPGTAIPAQTNAPMRPKLPAYKRQINSSIILFNHEGRLIA